MSRSTTFNHWNTWVQVELAAYLGAAVVEGALYEKMPAAVRKDVETMVAELPPGGCCRAFWGLPGDGAGGGHRQLQARMGWSPSARWQRIALLRDAGVVDTAWRNMLCRLLGRDGAAPHYSPMRRTHVLAPPGARMQASASPSGSRARSRQRALRPRRTRRSPWMWMAGQVRQLALPQRRRRTRYVTGVGAVRGSEGSRILPRALGAGCSCMAEACTCMEAAARGNAAVNT